MFLVEAKMTLLDPGECSWFLEDVPDVFQFGACCSRAIQTQYNHLQLKQLRWLIWKYYISSMFLLETKGTFLAPGGRSRLLEDIPGSGRTFLMCSTLVQVVPGLFRPNTTISS